MHFTDLFIRRPVLAIVVSSLLLILGWQAANQLSIRHFPELENSVISVETYFRGASARTVQGFVTEPLQRHLATARGVEYISSGSRPGRSLIEVYVRLGEETNAVLSELIAKVNEAKFELPSEVEDPVVSVRTRGEAMMYIAFLSEQMSRAQVTDYLLRGVQPELSTLEGVGDVNVLSSDRFAMRVWLDPARMAALGVTATDVEDAIRRDNHTSTPGQTRGKLVQTSIDAETNLRDSADFGRLVIRQDGERRVRLGDVAEVELASENYETTSFSSGVETTFVSVNAAPGANPLEATDQVHQRLRQIDPEFPADLKYRVDYDASITIELALWEVVKTLLEAAAIVVLVIYLFLGSLRVVLIPLVTIPLSLIGVLFLIYSMGFSLNLLTLLAMVIAIGLVVDDAIVVVENVHRHIEEGKTPLQAALVGARQVALPVVAMTLTLAAVYAPIGFLGGLTGVLFSEFALTLAGAVLVSGIVALTLSPMLCSQVLMDQARQGRLSNWLDRQFGSLRQRYARGLQTTLGHRGAVFAFAAGILISLPPLLSMARSELAPREDVGAIFMVSEAPDYSNLDYLNRFQDQMVAAWKAVPETTGSFQVNQTGESFGGVHLKPWDQRERSQQEVQLDLQQRLNRISGLEIFSFSTPFLPSTDSGMPVRFVVASTADYTAIDEVSEAVLQAARQSGMFITVGKDLRLSRPQISVAIDRVRAARLGLSMEDIGDTLQVMLGESEVNRFVIEGRSYKVIPQAGRGFRLSREWLERYYVRSSSGQLIPLSTVISLTQKVEPNVLRQHQQLNSATIQGLMMPPHTLGDGLEFLERQLQQLAPAGYRAGYSGESLRYVGEQDSFAWLYVASLLLIYLVLAAQFNSFRDPLVVLVSVPLSIFGAVVPLAIGAVTLNIYTQIGLLTLIGLISKHGILIVDFANRQVLAGQDPGAAVLEAASQRLRPILMTTFATVLGVMPLVLASGVGANSRFAIGLMITCGMLVGTLFTLFVLPTFYLSLKSRRGGAAKVPASPANSPPITSSPVAPS